MDSSPLFTQQQISVPAQVFVGSQINYPTHISTSVDIIAQELSTIKDHNVATFQINPPKSQFNTKKVIDVDALIRSPNFNECVQLSKDSTGKTKYLNDTQLHELRETGNFSVPSQSFPGQEHKWSVSGLLQKGTDNIEESFYDDIASGTHQIIISIPNRIYKGEYITIKNSIKNLLYTFYDLPMLLFGLSCYKKEYSAHTIKWKLEEFVNDKFIEDVILNKNIAQGVFEVQSVNGVELHLVLDKREELLSKLLGPYASFKVTWDNNKIARRTNLQQNLYNPLQSEDDNIKLVLEEENKLYLKSLFELITAHLEKQDAEALISLIKNMNIYSKYMKNYESQKQSDLANYMLALKQNNNIRARIPSWIKDKEIEYRTNWLKQHPLDNVYQKISDELSGQEKYIYDFNKKIQDSNEYQNKKKELENKEIPGRVYVYKFRIMKPSNWKIKQDDGYYYAEKENIIQNSSTYFGWRIVNRILDVAELFYTGNYYTFINLWQGPFGLRSLWGFDKFHTSADINHNNGNIIKTDPHKTWFGRMKDLWDNISRSRDEFERKPDTSILGKDFLRIINIVWNYGIKGGIGLPLIFFGQPFLVMLNTLISATIILTSPVWSIGLSHLKHLFDLLVYDTESPQAKKFPLMQLPYILLVKFPLKGLFQGFLAANGVILHAHLAVLMYLWGVISNGTRFLHDSAMYHLILKHKAKIPSENGFLVKRVSGPGLSGDYFHLITSNIALVLLQYQLEIFEMDAYRIKISHDIEIPSQQLINYYEQFNNVGMTQSCNGSPTKEFNVTKNKLTEQLNQKIQEHWKNYSINNNIYSNQRVRLSRDELMITLETGKNICQLFVTSKIFPLLSPTEIKTFWASKNTAENDWIGLTKYCLTVQLGNAVLVPMEDIDSTGFHLTISDVDFTDFIKDLFDGNPSDMQKKLEPINPIVGDNKLMTISGNEMSIDQVFNEDFKTIIVRKSQIDSYNERHTVEKK